MLQGDQRQSSLLNMKDVAVCQPILPIVTSKHPEACLLLAVHAKTTGGNAASSRLRTRITELQLLPNELHLPLQIAAALS